MSKERFLVVSSYFWKDIVTSIGSFSTKAHESFGSGFCPVFSSLQEAEKHYSDATIIKISKGEDQ